MAAGILDLEHIDRDACARIGRNCHRRIGRNWRLAIVAGRIVPPGIYRLDSDFPARDQPYRLLGDWHPGGFVDDFGAF